MQLSSVRAALAEGALRSITVPVAQLETSSANPLFSLSGHSGKIALIREFMTHSLRHRIYAS